MTSSKSFRRTSLPQSSPAASNFDASVCVGYYMEGDSTSGVSWLWRAAAAVFVFINLGGMIWAISMGEPSHGLVHVALLFGGYLGWKYLSGSRKPDAIASGQSDPRMEYLQQSVDAIALEVERIGEAQRYQEKIQAEKAMKTPPKQP
jgi:hypothetical protein